MYWLEVWDYLPEVQRKALERDPRIKHQLEVRRCFAEYLYYDPKIYDQYHYRIQMLQISLRKQADAYSKLTVPCIEELRDDINDADADDIILSAGVEPLPQLLNLFFQHYIEHPSARASVLSTPSLRQFCQIQHSLLNRNLVKYTRGSPLLLPYPMLYCAHIDPLGNEVDGYVAVLWYGCTPDSSEKNVYTLQKYGADDRRLLQAEHAEEFVVSKAVILMGVAAQHWIREAVSAREAFAQLTECYLDPL